MAADFDLLAGGSVKEFASYQLPEDSFLYLLHAIAQSEPNARRLIEAQDWRMYLMDAPDVEHEFLRLHQYRRVDYQVAGTLSHLRLPHPSLCGTLGACVHERLAGTIDRESRAGAARTGSAAFDQRLPRHALCDLPIPPRGRVRRPKEVRLLPHAPRASWQARHDGLARRVHVSPALEAKAWINEPSRRPRKSVGLARRSRPSTRFSARISAWTTLVAERIPDDADPLRDVVFIVRAGALFPMYRTSSLLEQLKGKVHVPAVLFYPGSSSTARRACASWASSTPSTTTDPRSSEETGMAT